MILYVDNNPHKYLMNLSIHVHCKILKIVYLGLFVELPCWIVEKCHSKANQRGAVLSHDAATCRNLKQWNLLLNLLNCKRCRLVTMCRSAYAYSNWNACLHNCREIPMYIHVIWILCILLILQACQNQIAWCSTYSLVPCIV